MSSHRQDVPGAERGELREIVMRASRNAWAAVEQLAGALGTATVAIVVLLALAAGAAACVVGVGFLLLPVALRALHAVADRERSRISRWGPELLPPGPRTVRPLRALGDPAVRRELRWLAGHATLGWLLALFGVLLPLLAVRDASFPLWWQLMPQGTAGASIGLWTVDDWAGVLPVTLMGIGWTTILVGLTPRMAQVFDRRGRRLLGPDPDADLSLRVAELTATRAAALDAHATELRRIERSLHDGTQNRVVAVTVLLGTARRMLSRDPAAADALLERAQTAAEEALAELRAVARGILPPVLADRGLSGALTGLAATCPVPCRIDVDASARCAASVEATAYFVVAEALTNVSRHSRAGRVTVTVRNRQGRLHVRVEDDGQGGAEEGGGSGLVGIRRRIEALDGTLTLTSPPGGPTTIEVELPCGS